MNYLLHSEASSRKCFGRLRHSSGATLHDLCYLFILVANESLQNLTVPVNSAVGSLFLMKSSKFMSQVTGCPRALAASTHSKTTEDKDINNAELRDKQNEV